MTLESFLVDNHAEIVARTRANVASRSSPQTSALELEHGVPLFLSQLVATLKEIPGGNDGKDKVDGPRPPRTPAISLSAAEHGLSLLKFGFTIDQVVHDYGDVCQAVTELAEEHGSTLSIHEFRTLNRCLDNAIAGAVTAWSQGREHNVRAQTREGHAIDSLRAGIARLLDLAQPALEALCAGTVAINGATEEVLRRSLLDLRALAATGE
jgi:hypothetical protein